MKTKKTKPKSKKTFKIILCILLLFLAIALSFLVRNWIIWKNYGKQNIAISTDKPSYQKEETLILKIKNESKDTLCFSNFFPYILERKENGRWALYKYVPLQNKDLIVKCMTAGEIKAFETVLFGSKGIHRIAIPFCANCQVGTEFRANEIYHSNEFTIE